MYLKNVYALNCDYKIFNIGYFLKLGIIKIIKLMFFFDFLMKLY